MLLQFNPVNGYAGADAFNALIDSVVDEFNAIDAPAKEQ